MERLVPVTLGDVGMVLIIGLIGFVAAKNLPALLEILLLSRVSLSSGSRYAVKTLTGYIIATTAALMVFSSLGLSWGQVQWLVAEAARENQRVLEDPEPRISFDGFGDNSLTLVLRCYLGSVDDRLSVTSELHQT